MDTTEAKSSKKRRQNEDPEASAKRKQKKLKKALADVPAGATNIEGTPTPSIDAQVSKNKEKKPKKDRASKAAAVGIPASQESILDPVEISFTPSPEETTKSSKKSKQKKREPEGEPATDGDGKDEPDELASKVKKEKKDKKKKKKSEASDEVEAEGKKSKKEKKDKKKKKDRGISDEEDQREASVELGSEVAPTNGVNGNASLPSIAPEKKRKRKDKSLEVQATPPPTADKRPPIDSLGNGIQEEAVVQPQVYNSADLDPEPRGPPPVIKQEVSRWVPLWPRGWHQPITAAIEQHLTPKMHRYDSDIGGVLLSYKNVCLNDRPTRDGAATTDSESVKLLSVNEYGVGYCWLIAELELFVPKRGSWMEGELILQNQGHVGVVCWGKFNASIEASRLPPKWYWVAAPEDDNDVNMEFDADGEEHHSATVLGHWVDERGTRIHGNLRFRINNYDVGLSGDHSFLCIEGTMLSAKEENNLREKELKRANLGSTGGSMRRRQRQLPEFSMTDLGLDADAKPKSNWEPKKPRRQRSEKPYEVVEAMDVDVDEDAYAKAEGEAGEGAEEE